MMGCARSVGFADCCCALASTDDDKADTRDRDSPRESFARPSRIPAHRSLPMASPIPPSFHQQLPINGYPHQLQQQQQHPHHQQNGRANPFTRERYQQAIEVCISISPFYIAFLTSFVRE